MRITFLLTAPLAVALGASVAFAQEFNVDFNAAAGTPSPSYGGASGQAGTWNSLTASVPLGAVALTDTGGSATAVTLEVAAGPLGYNGLNAYNFDNPNTAGDVQSLMDDLLDVGGGFSVNPSGVLVTVKGLADATYDVYTYCFAPDNYLPGNGGFAWQTLVTVTNATTGQATAGSLDWPGSHAQGLTFTRHTVTITGGADLEILAEADVVTSGFGSLNGLQIIDSSSGGVSYCTQTKSTSVAGCIASLSVTGPSLSSDSWVLGNVPLGPAVTSSVGILIYTHGPSIGQSTFTSNITFGTLCLSGFLRSAPACVPLTLSGTANTCGNAFPAFSPACGGGALGIQPGDDVNVQAWYRDPPVGIEGANFSNAVFYTATP